MNLYLENHPKNFWRFTDQIPESIWQKAVDLSKPILDIPSATGNIEEILQLILGEGQFGTDHWRLSFFKQAYYDLKPLIPRPFIQLMRRFYQSDAKSKIALDWPIEKRYALFVWDIGRQILSLTGRSSLAFAPFWPGGNQFAFVLTHDIETGQGQEFVRRVADFEESLGFHSSFNFVPERYRIDETLLGELKERGFEVGLHGLKHDGKLFKSQVEFKRRAKLINEYLKSFEAVGFRAPLTHRQPEWMQELKIEYDLSFFDTDPYESIPGGTMSLWPFFIGHFVELPYTLVQDYTLTAILGEKSPRIWLDKIAFIEKYHGMALINSHPDYLIQNSNWDVYREFLLTMKDRKGYWHALPKETAIWWRNRSINTSSIGPEENNIATLSLRDGDLVMSFAEPVQGTGNS